MHTDQATLILASLLRTSRGFKSHNLERGVRLQILDADRLLDTYRWACNNYDYTLALAKLNAAYRALDAEPPSAAVESIAERRHPALIATDQIDRAAEMRAWQALLAEDGQ